MQYNWLKEDFGILDPSLLEMLDPPLVFQSWIDPNDDPLSAYARALEFHLKQSQGSVVVKVLACHTKHPL